MLSLFQIMAKTKVTPRTAKEVVLVPKQECPICKKLFENTSDLKDHILTCAKERSGLTCFSCSQTFKKAAYYRRHMSKFHNHSDVKIVDVESPKPKKGDIEQNEARPSTSKLNTHEESAVSSEDKSLSEDSEEELSDPGELKELIGDVSDSMSDKEDSDHETDKESGSVDDQTDKKSDSNETEKPEENSLFDEKKTHDNVSLDKTKDKHSGTVKEQDSVSVNETQSEANVEEGRTIRKPTRPVKVLAPVKQKLLEMLKPGLDQVEADTNDQSLDLFTDHDSSEGGSGGLLERNEPTERVLKRKSETTTFVDRGVQVDTSGYVRRNKKIKTVRKYFENNQEVEETTIEEFVYE